jgi:hypothetical protein
MFPELLAALSEGQRAIAHLVQLVLLFVAGVVYLGRRSRRPDETLDEGIPEEVM